MRKAISNPLISVVTEMNFVRVKTASPSESEILLYKKEQARAKKLEARNGLLFHWNKDKGVVCPRLK